MDIFVLLADEDGTTFSREQLFGVAVTSELEAKRFVREGKVGHSRSYQKVRVFNDIESALDMEKGKQ